MTVEFVDTLPPPRTGARSASNKRFAAELRNNPGAYARYPYPLASPRGFRSKLKRGQLAAFGPGYDVEIRGSEVYIAYTGEDA